MVLYNSCARRLVVVERKSFELQLFGRREDRLRLTEKNLRRTIKGREMQWLAKTWKEVWKGGASKGWFQRRIDADRTVIFQRCRNKWGRMISLAVIRACSSRVVVCSEGIEQHGWRKLSAATVKLVESGKRVLGRCADGGIRQTVEVVRCADAVQSSQGQKDEGINRGERLTQKENQVASKQGDPNCCKVWLSFCCPGCGRAASSCFEPVQAKLLENVTEKKGEPKNGTV